MPDHDPIQPQVTDKRVAPRGVLPRNAQGLVLTGIALLMVCIIALSGHNPPKAKLEPTPAGVEPNAARIEEYKKRIDEEARRLKAEQTQLARTQEAAASNIARAYAGQPPPVVYPSPISGDSLEGEKRKREFQSLFASNIALSFRPELTPAPSAMMTPSASDGLAKMLSTLAALTVQAGSGEAKPSTEPPSSQETLTAQDRAGRRDTEIDRADGKRYRLFEGTAVETVLTNRLDGSFSGPVNCMVTTDIYSHNGQHLLIPQGSRVLGEVRKVDSFGQQRLAVAFHRIIMPDGYSVSLDQFEGLNQIGETGLRDQVNHHYLQVFGVSMAIGAIAGLSQTNTRYGIDESAADVYRQGAASSLSQASMRILDRYLNVLPTFTIREGHRIKVYLSDDLLLPSYDHHQMADDI